jgi:hypothetical protein
VEESESYRRAVEMASLVSEISSLGEEEARLCLTVLEGFSRYLRARPAMPVLAGRSGEPGVY